MPEILHRVEMNTTPAALYDALTTQAGLAAWWTPMTQASPEVGATNAFRFGASKVGPDMEVTALVPGEHVEWRCTAGPWVGHAFDFTLKALSPNRTVLLFGHRGWDEASAFYMHCNGKWGYFLATSLKSYVETGVGAPHPEDPDM